jgi:hypothetical protein
MQYKIEATPQQLQDLATYVFDDYPHEIKNRQLIIESGEHTFAFFSMVKAFLKQPVLIDYMTRDLIKFVVL